jgi:ribonuclease E
MSKKMLIDASHPEETRVAITSGGKIEDFDFESLSRKPLRGNIYLARITRVEPSLQAAFVEYGGNRHGFLAFNEIHPDYYQIPVSDREVLRKAEALEAELAEALSALSGDDADTDPDLDEEDDGLRRLEADVPEHDAYHEEVEEPAPSREENGEPDEEEEEEEREPEPEPEPEDGGSDDDLAPSQEGEAKRDLPPDYAGEETAEEAGWHAIEEEEIASLPPREAERTPDVKDDEDGAPAAKAAPVAEATVEAEAEAAEGEAEGDQDEAEDQDGEKRRAAEGEEPRRGRGRRRRRGGRGRKRSGGEASGDEEPGEDEAKADADDEGGAPEPRARREDDDEGDEDEAPAPRRARRSDDPRAKEIAELERRYEEAKRERAKLLKNYRIQEVVKRRQIMLVQAVKEERGNKGAALTTYLSLAGRYGVLMPNTARGGGVSRKITNAADRKRLRKAMSDLEIPSGQGLIIRTAGAKRTKAELKRDYEYLSRLWETIRDTTLSSVAPCLIYEEASLIKRAIRDLYDKDTDAIVVQGEEGYREAKDFMKMLMPSHAKNVQPYREDVPLFLRHGIEQQIDAMYNPTVKLKSGGYVVIQQTEALVSIDVNSGRSTKERNVEQTALKTNLEAADEVARQCRLRDLAGLVVIDFIDMDERKNNRAVEKRLKDAMKTDRARIQLGGISDFGLLEFSRQRKRSGIVDGTTRLCPLCDGAGHVRSVEMAAMRILRSVEEEALKGKAGVISVQTATDVALYTLNQKRDWLHRIETTYGVTVEVTGDDHKNGDQYEMQTRGEPRAPAPSLRQAQRAELEAMDREDDEADAASDEADEEDEDDEAEARSDDEDRPKKRRRRGGRGRSRSTGAEGGSPEAAVEQASADASGEDEADDAKASGDGSDEEDGKPKKRRRRGRRGGRRNRRDSEEGGEEASAANDDEPEGEKKDDAEASTQTDEPEADDLSEDGEAVAESYQEVSPKDAEPAAPEAPKTDGEAPAEPIAADAPVPNPAPEPVEATPPTPAPASNEDAPPKGPKRGGWWQRALGRS